MKRRDVANCWVPCLCLRGPLAEFSCFSLGLIRKTLFHMFPGQSEAGGTAGIIREGGRHSSCQRRHSPLAAMLGPLQMSWLAWPCSSWAPTQPRNHSPPAGQAATHGGLGTWKLETQGPLLVLSYLAPGEKAWASGVASENRADRELCTSTRTPAYPRLFLLWGLNALGMLSFCKIGATASSDFISALIFPS